MQSLVLSYSQRQYTKAARAGLEAANLNLKDAREQVALDASTTYLELDTVNSELAAARQQESFAANLLRIEEQRTEAGVDPLSDLLEARLTEAQLKLKRLHLRTRAGTLAKQLSTLTGLPLASIVPDPASIPEIPALTADEAPRTTPEVESAQMLARSRQKAEKADAESLWVPQIAFGVLYNRNTTLLNYVNEFYNRPLPTNDFSSGFNIQLPVFDLRLRARAKESAADALRAKVEAEQAERQNDVQIATLNGTLQELDAQAEVADLKRQIAEEQLKTVLTQLELGNGAESGPNATPQLSPKAEQQARINERQNFDEALEAGLDLSKARLNLLRALGHMEDWLNELHGK